MSFLRRRISPHVCPAVAIVATLGLVGCSARLSVPFAEPAREPRNVILLIGDGLGATALTMARNYHLGAAGRLEIDRLPHSGSCTTYAVHEEPPHAPDYVTDSAASATAIATGRKTSNRRLSTEPATDAPIPTILERAQRAGYRTGLVSTAHLADATPAAFAAHVNYRWCFDPATMVACPTFATMFGGPGSIVEQLVDARPDVMLGGGRGSFEQRIAAGEHAGATVLEAAAAKGFRVVADGADLESLTPGDPVLGLFAANNFVPVWEGEAASFPPGPPTRCHAADVPPHQPALAVMVETALRLLAADDDAAGFFLMAEAAMIDKQAHVADACGQIGDTIEFDRAVAVARAWAERHPETLLIVVGDHDHTPLIVDPKYAAYGPGITTTLETADGVPMTIAYATSRFGLKQQHTGAQLPVAAFGPGAERVSGLIDHADLFRIMSDHLALDAVGSVSP